MRYGKIFTGYWTSPDISEQDVETKVIGAYLLSSTHSNMLGCFRLPIAYVVDDLRMGSETVSKGFRNLSGKGFLTHDPELSWVFIRNFLKWNPIENPNQGKAAAKLVGEVPTRSSVYAPLVQILKANPANFPEGFINSLETLLEPFRNQYPYPQPYPEQEQEQKSCAALVPIAALDVVISIPLCDGSEHQVTQPDVDEWTNLFPAVDVLQELRNYRAWALSKPKKRKTRRGIKASVTSWLMEKQDKYRPTEGTHGTSCIRKSPAVERQRASDDAIRQGAALLEGCHGFDEPGASQLPEPGVNAGDFSLMARRVV